MKDRFRAAAFSLALLLALPGAHAAEGLPQPKPLPGGLLPELQSAAQGIDAERQRLYGAHPHLWHEPPAPVNWTQFQAEPMVVLGDVAGNLASMRTRAYFGVPEGQDNLPLQQDLEAWTRDYLARVEARASQEETSLDTTLPASGPQFETALLRLLPVADLQSQPLFLRHFLNSTQSVGNRATFMFVNAAIPVTESSLVLLDHFRHRPEPFDGPALSMPDVQAIRTRLTYPTGEGQVPHSAIALLAERRAKAAIEDDRPAAALIHTLSAQATERSNNAREAATRHSIDLRPAVEDLYLKWHGEPSSLLLENALESSYRLLTAVSADQGAVEGTNAAMLAASLLGAYSSLELVRGEPQSSAQEASGKGTPAVGAPGAILAVAGLALARWKRRPGAP